MIIETLMAHLLSNGICPTEGKTSTGQSLIRFNRHGATVLINTSKLPFITIQVQDWSIEYGDYSVARTVDLTEPDSIEKLNKLLAIK
jgi:hypothetical protein